MILLPLYTLKCKLPFHGLDLHLYFYCSPKMPDCIETWGTHQALDMSV